MIEFTVLQFLTHKLPHPVYAEMPTEPPDRFFILNKADRSRENRIDSTIFTVWSYAESKLEAARLNERAVAAMDSLIELDEVAASLHAGDYPFPDSKNKRYRYQAVYNITHY